VFLLGAGSLLAGTAAVAAYCWKKSTSSTRTSTLSMSTTTTTTTTIIHNPDSTENRSIGSSTSSSMRSKSPSNYDDHPQNPQDSADDQAKMFADAASKHYTDKNYEKAIDGFTKALELVPDNFRFYTNRAMAHLASKNYQEAFLDAKASVDLESTSKGHYTLGRGAQGVRKYDEAIQAYKQVLTFKEAGTSEYAKKSIQKCYKAMAQEFVDDHYRAGEEYSAFKVRVGDNAKKMPDYPIKRAWKKKNDKRKEEGMQSQEKESIPSTTENNLSVDTTNNITNQEATNNVTIQEATDNATIEGATNKGAKVRR